MGQVSQRGVRVTARETDRWRDRGRGVAGSLPRPGAGLAKKLCALRSTDKREEPLGPLPVGPAAQRGRGREARRLISAHSPSLCSPPSSFPPLHGLRRTLIPLSCCFFKCRWVVGRKESWTGRGPGKAASRPSGSAWCWPPWTLPLHPCPSSFHGTDAVIPILQVRKLRPGKQVTFPQGQQMASKRQSWNSVCLPTRVAGLCPPTLCSELAGGFNQGPLSGWASLFSSVAGDEELLAGIGGKPGAWSLATAGPGQTVSPRHPPDTQAALSKLPESVCQTELGCPGARVSQNQLVLTFCVAKLVPPAS